MRLPVSMHLMMMKIRIRVTGCVDCVVGKRRMGGCGLFGFRFKEDGGEQVGVGLGVEEEG